MKLRFLEVNFPKIKDGFPNFTKVLSVDMTPPPCTRLIEWRMDQAMQDMPLVLWSGPVNKTTLARQMAKWPNGQGGGLPSITLGDPLALQSARADPVCMVRPLKSLGSKRPDFAVSPSGTRHKS